MEEASTRCSGKDSVLLTSLILNMAVVIYGVTRIVSKARCRSKNHVDPASQKEMGRERISLEPDLARKKLHAALARRVCNIMLALATTSAGGWALAVSSITTNPLFEFDFSTQVTCCLLLAFCIFNLALLLGDYRGRRNRTGESFIQLAIACFVLMAILLTQQAAILAMSGVCMTVDTAFYEMKNFFRPQRSCLATRGYRIASALYVASLVLFHFVAAVLLTVIPTIFAFTTFFSMEKLAVTTFVFAFTFFTCYTMWALKSALYRFFQERAEAAAQSSRHRLDQLMNEWSKRHPSGAGAPGRKFVIQAKCPGKPSYKVVHGCSSDGRDLLFPSDQLKVALSTEKMGSASTLITTLDDSVFISPSTDTNTEKSDHEFHDVKL